MGKFQLKKHLAPFAGINLAAFYFTSNIL